MGLGKISHSTSLRQSKYHASTCAGSFSLPDWESQNILQIQRRHQPLHQQHDGDSSPQPEEGRRHLNHNQEAFRELPGGEASHL